MGGERSAGSGLAGAALSYGGRGWPVIPLYSIADGRCTCGKANCDSPGKHPRTAHGLQDASADAAVLAAWWARWPDANIGIAMGGPARLVALDIDGPEGEAALEELLRKHGPLPTTLESRTGKGRHLLFTAPEGVTVGPSVGKLGKGIDFRGQGSYIVAPPSLHVIGRFYQWGNQGPIACLPEWLTRLLTAPRRPPTAGGDGAERIRKGERNVRLTSIAGSLRHQRLSGETISAALLSINGCQCDPPLPEAEVSRIAASIASHAPGPQPETADSLAKLECFAEILPKPLCWVWRDRIPAGKLSLLVGDPDKGKSLVTIDIAARITTGRPFPDGAPAERGSVIMLSAEDDAEDTIRPRLDAAGADVSRVHHLKAVRVVLRDGKQVERGFSLESDISALYDAIRQTRDVRLIVIDPISAYLGTADSHNNAEVRGLLAPLAEMAARTGVAILAVTHLRKSGGSAIHRAMGSLAFAAAARAAWGVAADADDSEKRIMVRVKGNLSHDPGGLAYRIEVTSGVPRIAWEPGAVNLRADDALGGLDSREDRSERREAESWLKDFLADGPKSKREVEGQSKQAGFSPATIRRAADALRIKKQKSGFDLGWEWCLPEHAQPEDAHPVRSGVSTFEAAIEKKADTVQSAHEDAQPERVSTFGRVSTFEEGEA